MRGNALLLAALGTRAVHVMSARQLSEHARDTLQQWLFDEEHFDFPYPTDEEKNHLAEVAEIPKKQINTWFTNARKRIWAPERERRGLRAFHVTEANVAKRLRESIKTYGTLTGQPTPAHATTATVGAKRKRAVDGVQSVNSGRRTRSTHDSTSSVERILPVTKQEVDEQTAALQDVLTKAQAHIMRLAVTLCQAHACAEIAVESTTWESVQAALAIRGEELTAAGEVLAAAAAVARSMPQHETHQPSTHPSAALMTHMVVRYDERHHQSGGTAGMHAMRAHIPAVLHASSTSSDFTTAALDGATQPYHHLPSIAHMIPAAAHSAQSIQTGVPALPMPYAMQYYGTPAAAYGAVPGNAMPGVPRNVQYVAAHPPTALPAPQAAYGVHPSGSGSSTQAQ